MIVVIAASLVLASLPDPPPKGDCYIVKNRVICRPPQKPDRPRLFPRPV